MRQLGQLLLLLALLLLASLSLSSPKEIDLFKSGKCIGKWRPEKLPGRCTGMNPGLLPSLNLPPVENATACRAICCNLGDKCITWQFEITTRECRFGLVMRLGDEAAGVPGWCDPIPPVKWNGRKVVGHNPETGEKIWGNENLDSQCFGLGAERLSSAGKRRNTQECEQACKDDPKCEIWQEFPGRGCYFFSLQGIFCEKKKNPIYVGGRKCLAGSCGKASSAAGEE